MQKYPIFQLRFVKDLISTDNIFLALLWQHQTRGQAWHPSYDPLHKFRIVLDGLNSSCKWHYVPGQQIAMDESPTGMKNRTELMQYIPNKHHHKWGGGGDKTLLYHRIFYWILHKHYGVPQKTKVCSSIRTWTFIWCCYETFVWGKLEKQGLSLFCW